jgi:seryl-tRNA synthetase
MTYKGHLGDIRRNMNHLRNNQILQDQIKEINKELEKELGMKITKKVWDLINTLIIKVGQYYQNNMDMNEEKLREVYATIPNNIKQHIRNGDTE